MDSQYSDPNDRASTVNLRKSESISVIDGSIAFSHNSRPKSVTSSVRKLRKKPPVRDGYESAGGYVSEKKATKKGKSGETMEGKVKKKKSFIQVINKFSNEVQSQSQGYESDGGSILTTRKSKKKSKPRSPSKENGYDTDGGYQSENRKSKSRFFKLSTRSSSKPDFHLVANGPVPALPNSFEKKAESAVPLPIAGKFARTRTLSYSMPNPTTTTESAETHIDHSFPHISLQPFPVINDFTSTASSPVSAPPSTYDRAQIAPMSDSPSAFNAHLHPRKRDSRFSSTSSSGSGSNHHHKLQNKGLFSPLHSPPSSNQGHQLRPSLSLSSLNHSKPVISYPITRDMSPTSTNPSIPSSRSLHSLTVSPTSPSDRSSVSSLQSKKPFRIKIHHHPDLQMQQPSPAQTLSSSSRSESPHVFLAAPALPLIQIPRITKVRPKNPPTDGFGPRSPLTSDSASLGSTLRSSPIFSPIPSPSSFSPLSPNSLIQAGSKRSSEQTIIPSSDYIVPSPQDSPLKPHYSGLPSPTAVLAAYHIAPPPSPAPRGPLPTPPSSCESGDSPIAGNGSSSSGSSNDSHSSGHAGGHHHQPPFAAHMRQKMPNKMNLQQQSLLSLSQSTTVATQPVSSGVEKTGVVGLRIEKKGGFGSSADDVAKFQKREGFEEDSSLSRFTSAVNNRRSWIETDVGDTSLDDTLEVEVVEHHHRHHQQDEEDEPEDLYEILNRFDSQDDHNENNPHSRSSEQALGRSHSFKAGKLAKEQRYHHHYPDNNNNNNNGFDDAPPNHHQHVPAAVAAPDLYGFEDDGKSVGDRTSRWTESVYSTRSSTGNSILDEEESEERRGRLLRRVEAMLDAEKFQAQDESSVAAHHHRDDIPPPLPEIPQAYADIMHKQNRNNNDYNNNSAGHRSNFTPGRSWNKF